MERTALLLSIATFVVIILLYLAVSSLVTSRRNERNVLRRAAKWRTSAAHSDSSALPEEQEERKRKGFSLAGFFKKTNPDLTTSFYADTPLFYQRAGIYDRKSVRSLQTLRVVLFLAPLVILLLSHLLYYRPVDLMTILATLVIVIVAYYLPVGSLRVIAHYRKKELYKTFPDAIDLLMVCIEAGMGVDAAIRRVSREIFVTSPELAKEFRILSLELKTGKSRNECLKNLAMRTDLSDIDNLVSLMIQAERYGTGVVHALRIHAEEMRQKRFSRLEQLAAQLPVKLTIPLILFIFPAFFVVIAGPAAIQVFRVIIQR
jgi:tight adherence protein C